ncbi:phospholipid scramblase 2-like isoform X2 [Apis laboriosa]|uniref:phospholipid scramblase 2-like isoform X2 n=1 Tax=Apis laboriosa TaxID=183418 RepID=UPI001CC474EB|nr:phospholipid scramblase 2-like isoform X2 [Apis laboriosa]XP_043790762.1 phospholipid scramblase 2-like isoform X2 [Apis laboriosa]XP_043790764.1 phospholipid scramblase 2-like isoform X2 [Apis laboriosa]XP_043790765.1 phospholipid scramblase 2-like isoform X2 [Apis laboriosa]XP_043790766.1 phospholipid scramblase 2-like isoform X2 [Apis laboriosa]
MMKRGGLSLPNMTCPTGLEYLIVLDYLGIRLKNTIEVDHFWNAKNEFFVLNIRGETIFNVTEQSDWWGRLCLGASRTCEFHVTDTYGREILRMVQPFTCSFQKLQVYSEDILLGSVSQNCFFLRPTFSINDSTGKTVLKLKGPRFPSCNNIIVYKIKSADDKHKVGQIKITFKMLNYFVPFTDITTGDFNINFPLDLDVKIKSILLGACFLLDLFYKRRRQSILL